MSETVLELKDVHRTFMVRQGVFRPKRPLHAVSGVSLRLERGEALGLVGESGCGKSTLAKMLLGLLPPSSGEIRVAGKPFAQADRQAIARRVQPIFQDPYSSLNPRKTLAQIIALPLVVHRIGDREARRQRVRELMDVVGLPARLLESYPSQLSGGQRQRVAIARALAIRPEVLICDEPTSALDVSVQAQILNLLVDLRRELGLSYVLISHNLAVVEHLADRVAVMYLGRIVEQQPTEGLFAEPRHPYTRALLESVLTPDPGQGVPETHLGATFPNPIDPPSGCAFHPRCPECMGVCKTVPPRPLVCHPGMVECHLHDDETLRKAS
ncbi:oligopeptide/dipeptide ABC transporter ATP-binding protein [Geminicoccaceae bacterium 1502E]|nr:oligopeptide/dipeptide ABC transporter ATP-binding protein [Geminicoccaceae bacterium 1502E]